MSDGVIAATVLIPDAEIAALEQRLTEQILERIQEDACSPWLTVDQAAEHLAWPKKRLYNLVSKGEIPHRKQGNRLLFNRVELDRWLDLHYHGPEEFTP
jgi:excisionase family DNA binding protein